MVTPMSVKQAVLAIWITLALSVLGTVIATILGYTPVGEMALGIVFCGAFGVLPYKIGQGSNPARYVYLALSVLSLLALVSGVVPLTKPDFISSIFQIPLMIFAMLKLFLPPGTDWFTRKKQPPPLPR